MLEYKGYIGVVEFDNEARLFHGTVANTKTVITFQGTSVAELEREFRTSVDVYLAWCAKRGKEPEKPFSGKFMVRVPIETHRAIAVAAARAHKSMNAWVREALETAAQHSAA